VRCSAEFEATPLWRLLGLHSRPGFDGVLPGHMCKVGHRRVRSPPAPRLPGDAGLRLPPMPLQAFGRSVVRHDAGRQVLTLLAEVCMSWKIGGPRMGDD
jgi:hypothetical protein